MKAKRAVLTALICISIITAASPARALAFEPEAESFTVEDGERIAVPLTYAFERKSLPFESEQPLLSNPKDLFMGEGGLLYVADTDNSRIVVLDGELRYVREFHGAGRGALSSPEGIFVGGGGEMYIADTGNQRVVLLDAQGEFVKEFTRPESDMLDKDTVFDPSKVILANTGFLYVLRGRQFMSIDEDGRFQGFIGSTRLPFDLLNAVKRLFATEQQKQKLARPEPEPYQNIFLGGDGMVYGVTASGSQIRKINSVGLNVYPEASYGLPVQVDELTVLPQSFTDIAVDANGIIFTLDQTAGVVYQFDQEGNTLGAFGSLGNKKGMFQVPISLACGADGRLYVLDNAANHIQSFAPTHYSQVVQQAVERYSAGDYAAAERLWNEVLQINQNYSLANKAIGNTYYKRGEWEQAMEYFRLADYKPGYNKAFEEYRKAVFKEYFIWIVLAVAAVACGLVYGIKHLLRHLDRYFIENRWNTPAMSPPWGKRRRGNP